MEPRLTRTLLPDGVYADAGGPSNHGGGGVAADAADAPCVQTHASFSSESCQLTCCVQA